MVVGCFSVDQSVDLTAWHQDSTPLQLFQSINQQQTWGDTSGLFWFAECLTEGHWTALHYFAECLNRLTARRHSCTVPLLRKDYILPVGMLPCVDKLNARPQKRETQVMALLSTAFLCWYCAHCQKVCAVQYLLQ